MKYIPYHYFISALLVISCQNKSNKKQARSENWHYKYDLESCSTGGQVGKGKEALCQRLIDEQANSSCAQKLRMKHYEGVCGPLPEAAKQSVADQKTQKDLEDVDDQLIKLHCGYSFPYLDDEILKKEITQQLNRYWLKEGTIGYGQETMDGSSFTTFPGYMLDLSGMQVGENKFYYSPQEAPIDLKNAVKVGNVRKSAWIRLSKETYKYGESDGYRVIEYETEGEEGRNCRTLAYKLLESKIADTAVKKLQIVGPIMNTTAEGDEKDIAVFFQQAAQNFRIYIYYGE